MATHDYIISNASGAAVRADLNNALAAIATNNSSATEPTTTYAYQWWADTGSSPTVMKLRNAANSAWITLFQLDGEWTVVPFENGTAAAPSIYFKDSGTDTGIYSPGTDQVGISAGGTSRFEVSTSATTSTLPVVHPLGAVGTPSITFTGDLNTGIWSPAADTVAVSTNGTRAITIDSSQRLGIGTTSPSTILHVASTAPYIRIQDTDSNTGVTAQGGFEMYDSDGDRLFYLANESSSSADVGLFNMAGGALKFGTSGSERGQFDSSGRLLVGTSSARSNIREGTDNETPKIQLESATNDYSEAGLSIINNSSSGFAPQLWLGRSASDSIGGNALVSSGRIGSISFNAADGTNFIQGARIQADIDGTSGSGDLPTRLSFSTTADGASSPTERFRITSSGTIYQNYALRRDTGNDFSQWNTESTDGKPVIEFRATNTSYANTVLNAMCERAANSTYGFFSGFSGAAAADREFLLRGDGNGYCDGSWNGGGADYAEYFEWSDSNPDEEDRRGISVVLDGDKIREAVAGEDPIGVISGNPSVVGDAAWNKWSGKYLRDEFGTYVQEDYEIEDENGSTVIQQRRKLNPAYDPDQEYIPREQRSEWDCVGLMGKLRIRKGQVTGSRWIKMRDISDSVEEWLVR